MNQKHRSLARLSLAHCRDDFGSCWDEHRKFLRSQESAECKMDGSEETLGFRLVRDNGIGGNESNVIHTETDPDRPRHRDGFRLRHAGTEVHYGHAEEGDTGLFCGHPADSRAYGGA